MPMNDDQQQYIANIVARRRAERDAERERERLARVAVILPAITYDKIIDVAVKSDDENDIFDPPGSCTFHTIRNAVDPGQHTTDKELADRLKELGFRVRRREFFMAMQWYVDLQEPCRCGWACTLSIIGGLIIGLTIAGFIIWHLLAMPR